ncbi:MAG: glycosyltransferase family 39 protein [Opitutales bacterium]
MDKKVDALKICFAAAAALTAIAVPLKLVPSVMAIHIVKHHGYLLMTLTTVAFLAVLGPALLRAAKQAEAIKGIRCHALGLLLIVLGTLFLHLHEARGFKILFDEHVLSSTAMNLHTKQLAYAQTAGHVIGEEEIISIGFVDKRPLLFPYILAVTHNIFGYAPENVFWLNGALSLSLLSLLYGLVAFTCGRTHGALAVLLFVGLPLLAQNTNGGGYELLNLCLIAALIISGIRYLQEARPTGGLDLMVMVAVLLANVRYESLLYVLVPAVLFLIKCMRTKTFRLTWLSALSPFFLILPLLNYNIFQSEPRFIQTTQDNFFSLIHLKGNLEHATAYLFDPSGHYSNSALLSGLGIASALMLFIHVATRIRHHLLENSTLTVVLVVFAVAATNTTLALTCYWGAWTDPLTSRFSLPLQWFFALGPPFLLREHFQRASAPVWLILLAGLQLVLVTPGHTTRMASEPRITNSLGYNWALDWIRHQAPAGNHLYVSKSATGVCLLSKGSIPFIVANAMPERVLLSQELGIYDELYAVQLLLTLPGGKTASPGNSEPLNPRYELEPVAEKRMNAHLIYRISRITGLAPATDSNRTDPADMPLKPPKGAMNAEDLERYYKATLPIAPKSFNRSHITAASKD